MTICPDNSTECLLRVLIERNSSYDWDPLNFAVTAAIGVLALLVACATVFQGLLAAGPGRIKASKAAIGPWVKFTKSRFDRHELGLRTTAFVPYIKDDVLHYLHFDPTPDPTIDESSSASWLLLLSSVGLARPSVLHGDIDGSSQALLPSVARATDYLPADIMAAPAAGEMFALLMLAIIADGEATITKERGKYLTVVGKRSQLSFREHPIMGLVAAWEKYGKLETWKNFVNMRPSALHRLYFAQGRLTSRTEQLLGMTPLGCGRRPWISCSPSPLREAMARMGSGCGHALCSQSLYIPVGQEADTVNPYVLLIADTPTYWDFVAFPYSTYGIEGLAERLRQACSKLCEPDELWSNVMNADVHLAGQCHCPSGTATDSEVVKKCPLHQAMLPLWGTFKQPYREPPRIVEGMKNGFQYVLGQQPNNNVEDYELNESLLEFDEYLTYYGGREIGCALMHLIFDLCDEDTQKQWRTKSNGGATTFDATAQFTDVIPDKRLAAGLRGILIWRGLLLAAVLSRVCDTSALFDEDFTNYTVKVL